MIDLSPVLSPPTPPAAQAVATPGSMGGTPRTPFGQTLGAFLDGKDAASAQVAAGERQGVADDGKDLPEAAEQGDDQPQEANADATPAWFPAFMLPTPPVPAPIPPTAGALSDTFAVAPEISATSLATPESPKAPQPIANQTASDLNAPPLNVAPQPRITATSEPALPITHLMQPPPVPVASIIIDAPAPLAVAMSATIATSPTVAVAGQVATSAVIPPPKPTSDGPGTMAADTPSAVTTSVAPARADPAAQAIAVSTMPQPAGQVFAAAIATATSWRARSAQSGEREPTDIASAFAAIGPATVSDRAVVQATGDAGNASLDLTRDSGLQGMIDRIETLRAEASDTADAADTRVRLTPDALGSVDIAVRQEGTRVHVHFTAEQDATRALIADAQPRLTELAAARGVRIGETSVGSGAGGGNLPQQPQTQADPRFARAPASVATPTDSTLTDHRLA